MRNLRIFICYSFVDLAEFISDRQETCFKPTCMESCWRVVFEGHQDIVDMMNNQIFYFKTVLLNEKGGSSTDSLWEAEFSGYVEDTCPDEDKNAFIRPVEKNSKIRIRNGCY
ncbi:hypothetical protein PPL_09846 [Heterostelium album PN500]|uniref:Uncharacterized protein n=1 Tax=Heterostelium pallidum (strain ATCC 26659 / Pp 5 / PN500) TaxID=670386 RepID=D3BP83_HETP5|nr:hypothetical protein PPL_09846 [Heterostelium album PN500]EFA77093.1 hypothetical protein PPL_09846 [Heterostelium album PN500]|eukprot:XP_020429222.1 hypothetical protein PPL_09846 [Heterostelium album PN500]